MDAFQQLLGIRDAPSLVEHLGSQPGVAVRGPSIECRPGDGPAVWMDGPECRVLARPRRSAAHGVMFARFANPSGEEFPCLELSDGSIELPFSLTEAYEGYVTERWAATGRGRSLTTGQLDAYYRIKRAIPRSVQLTLRRRMIRWQGVPSFPRWPYDDSVERLVRFYAGCVLRATARETAPFKWFWPEGAHAAVILTHDVEGEAGLANALRIADLEEERGFRSSFNIVGNWYPIDWGVVRELRDRGHEIGSHAIYHDRSLFSTRTEFERQLPMLRDLVDRLGAVGFRSPATHRVTHWLSELPVEYDATMPHSDPYEPQPGGVCTVWPFFIGDVVELPYTLPQDHTLFNLLGHDSVTAWVEQVKRIKQAFGLVQCVTHPDPGYLGEPRNERLYSRFLDTLAAEDHMWHPLPSELARWWRARRDRDVTQVLPEQRGTVVRRPDSALAELVPPTPAA